METPKEKAKRLGVPLIPQIKNVPKPPNTHGIISVCGECGLELRQIMGYVCGKNNCPVGLAGITWMY